MPPGKGKKRRTRRRLVMEPEPAQTPSFNAAGEDAIHHKMITAWNAGDATAFVAPFTDDVSVFTTWPAASQ